MNTFSAQIENYNFAVLDGTLDNPSSTWKVNAHLHNFYELHYILSGSASLYVNGKTAEVKEKELYTSYIVRKRKRKKRSPPFSRRSFRQVEDFYSAIWLSFRYCPSPLAPFAPFAPCEAQGAAQRGHSDEP